MNDGTSSFLPLSPLHQTHADETNDVFRLAAQAVAWTSLRADQLLGLPHPPPAAGLIPPDHAGAAAIAAGAATGVTPGPAASVALAGVGLSLTARGGVGVGGGSGSLDAAAAFGALQAAWLPLRLGHKPVWWEAVSFPGGGGAEAAAGQQGGELEFRQQLRALAADSLALLTRALPAQASRYPALFALRLWGSVVGMWENNNLALVVPSPLARYAALLQVAAPLSVGAGCCVAAECALVVVRLTNQIYALLHAQHPPRRIMRFRAGRR